MIQVLGESHMSTLNAGLVQNTLCQTFAPGIFSRTPAPRKNVIQNDPANAYRNLILALARKFTNSPEEAEVAAKVMFADIHRQAKLENRRGFRRSCPLDRMALARLVRFAGR